MSGTIPNVELTEGLSWLTFEGRKVFVLSGVSGGVSDSLCAVLIQTMPTLQGIDFGRRGFHEEYGGRWFVIEWALTDPPSRFLELAHEAIAALKSTRGF